MVPTTFVFGAGVSYPFGYPLGSHLVDTMSEHLRRHIDREDTVLSDIFIELDLFLDYKSCQSIYYGLTQAHYPSLDRFVQSNPKYDLVVRQMIASHLVPLEMIKIHNVYSNKPSIRNDNALRVLWQAMMEEGAVEKELLKHNFITFNYDRTLEHFLFKAIQNSRGLDQSEAMRILNAVPVLHVYGALGKYVPDKFDESFRPNSVGMLINEITDATDSLKLIGNPRVENDMPNQMADLFSDTERVMCLGYGFDGVNNALLKRAFFQGRLIDRDDVHQQNRMFSEAWYGSAYNQPDRMRKKIAQTLHIRRENLTASTFKDVAFLNKHL